MATLATTYLGLPLRNPLIVGSCGLTGNLAGIQQVAAHGAGAIVLKSIFEEELDARQIGGSEDPVKFDYQHQAARDQLLGEYFRLLADAKQEIDIPVIASINCVSDFEWPAWAEQLADAGADALELNVFPSPMDAQRTADAYEQEHLALAKKVKARLSIPVAMKICPYFSNMAAVIHRLSLTGIDGLVLFNRFLFPDIDIENFKVHSAPMLSRGNEYGHALRWTAFMSGRINSEICASTGVHSGETFIKFLLAGAQTVQVVSALYHREPEYLMTFLKELEFWMERHGFESIEAFRGKMAEPHNNGHSVFERAQYRRYSEEKINTAGV